MSGDGNGKIPVKNNKISFLQEMFPSPIEKNRRREMQAAKKELQAEIDKAKKGFKLLYKQGTDFVAMAQYLDRWSRALDKDIGHEDKTKPIIFSDKEYSALAENLKKHNQRFLTMLDDQKLSIQPSKVNLSPFKQLMLSSLQNNKKLEENFGLTFESLAKYFLDNYKDAQEKELLAIIRDDRVDVRNRVVFVREYVKAINNNKLVLQIDVNDLIANEIFAKVGKVIDMDNGGNGVIDTSLQIDATNRDTFCSAVINILATSKDKAVNKDLVDRAFAGASFYRWFKENYSRIDIKKLPESVLTKLISVAEKSTVTEVDEMYKTAAMLNAIIEQSKSNMDKLAAAKCLVNHTLDFVGTVCQHPDWENAAMPLLYRIPEDKKYARQQFINAVLKIIELDKFLSPEAKYKLLERAKEGAFYEGNTSRHNKMR